jgi:hemerythrin superfamily protein
VNIIELIRADHKHVSDLFHQWKAEQESAIKHDILRAIMRELDLHMSMENTVVYPEYSQLDPDNAEHAEEEHRMIRSLIAQIDAAPAPAIATWVAKLDHQVVHHVREEEKVGNGMLAVLANSNLDLDALGEAATNYKEEVHGRI